MAMKALKASHVKTWDQLIAELDKMPEFPKDKLPPRSPTPSATGRAAKNIIDSTLASGGDIARFYAFRKGRSLDDVEQCFAWPLYSRRSSLAADPPVLEVFTDKAGEIVAYLQADPNS